MAIEEAVVFLVINVEGVQVGCVARPMQHVQQPLTHAREGMLEGARHRSVDTHDRPLHGPSTAAGGLRHRRWRRREEPRVAVRPHSRCMGTLPGTIRGLGLL